MISQELLEILRCPITKSTLSLASSELVERLAQRQQSGGLVNELGEAVAHPIEAGLVGDPAIRFFPIVDEIPCMLIEESIPLAQLDGAA